MSLIDKQLRAARLQKEFAIQRQELAYKSFNGTRQAARNFREGTLNIGQMGFDNTAEERITKEMITDYHKKEQDRIEERLAGRTKTTLHDTIDAEIVVPRVTEWATTKRAATTDDLMHTEMLLSDKVNELAKQKEVLRQAPIRIDELEGQKIGHKRLGFKWMTLQRAINKYHDDIALAKTEIPKIEKSYTRFKGIICTN